MWNRSDFRREGKGGQRGQAGEKRVFKWSEGRKENRAGQKWENLFKDATSFFISNLPTDWDKKAIWEELQVCGTLVDLYIPGWKDKHGFLFGFARFNRVTDKNEMIKKISQVAMGGKKLFVTLAKFERKQVPDERKKMHVEGSMKEVKAKENGSYAEKVKGWNEQGRGRVEQKTDKKDDGKGRKEDGVEENTNENTKDERIRLTVSDNKERVTMLKSKLVGKVKHVRALEKIEEVFRGEGYKQEAVDFIGGLWVLISISGEEQASFLSNENLVSWFTSIQPWDEEFVIEERLTWLTISGVPLKVWNDDSFIKIAKKWGEVISMESCIFGGVDCSVGKVCILTRNQGLIMGAEEIWVEDKLITIRIMECGELMVSKTQEEDIRVQEEELEEGEIRGDWQQEDGGSDAGDHSPENMSGENSDDSEEDEESVNFESSEDERMGSPNKIEASAESKMSVVEESKELNMEDNEAINMGKEQGERVEETQEWCNGYESPNQKEIRDPEMENKNGEAHFWTDPNQVRPEDGSPTKGSPENQDPIIGEEEGGYSHLDNPSFVKAISPRLKSLLERRNSDKEEKGSGGGKNEIGKRWQRTFTVYSPRMTRSKSKELRKEAERVSKERGEGRSISEELKQASDDARDNVFKEIGECCGFTRQGENEETSSIQGQKGAMEGNQ